MAAVWFHLRVHQCWWWSHSLVSFCFEQASRSGRPHFHNPIFVLPLRPGVCSQNSSESDMSAAAAAPAAAAPAPAPAPAFTPTPALPAAVTSSASWTTSCDALLTRSAALPYLQPHGNQTAPPPPYGAQPTTSTAIAPHTPHARAAGTGPRSQTPGRGVPDGGHRAGCHPGGAVQAALLQIVQRHAQLSTAGPSPLSGGESQPISTSIALDSICGSPCHCCKVRSHHYASGMWGTIIMYIM